MNKTEEFKSLQEIYFKRVLLKEEVENSLPTDLEQKIEDNVDELKKAIENLEAELLAQEKYRELINKFFDEIKKSPKDFTDQKEIEQSFSQEEIKEESYVEEKLGSRIASNVSGWKRFAMGEKTPTGESNVQSQRVNKRFEIFQKKVGSHLKELQRDLGTTSGADDSVKKQIDGMIAKLESEYSIKPTESKLSDIRHSIGRGVEFVGKAAPLLALGAAAGGALASIAGIAGIPATMLKAATAGALRKAATDVLNGERPDPKKVAKQAAILAVAAPILGVSIDYLSKYINGLESEMGLTANEPSAELIDQPVDAGLNPDSYFERYHETPFNPESPLDVAKNKFDSALFEKGINGQGDWSNGPSPAFVNAAKNLDLSPEQYAKAAEKLSSISDEQMKPVMNFIDGNIRGAANTGEAQKWAAAFIKELLK
jgi:hypothetical protein